MKLGRVLQQRLGWKLFLSHFVVVVVGTVILAAVAYWHAPTALSHHLSSMQEMIGTDHGMAADLRRSFLDAVGEVLLVAGISAAAAAVFVSTFVAWRIIGPIRSMTDASRRIADGDYSERVDSAWNDELGDLADSFNRMAVALDETEKRRLELIGNVAHELRTPLTTIRSMMEGLIDGVLPADTETFVDVQREASRLQRLTSELGELSRAEAGEIALEYAATNPRELVQKAAARLQSQFDDKGIELTVDAPETLPDSNMDEERMLQVLLNLLGNALQYTERGGSVRLSCRAVSGELCFSVSDTGVGISPEELPRLFDRFYRVDKSRARSRGGSGIGLTIAAHLVRAHGGRIRAESEGPGQGSTFTFCIPIVTES